MNAKNTVFECTSLISFNTKHNRYVVIIAERLDHQRAIIAADKIDLIFKKYHLEINFLVIAADVTRIAFS